MDKRDALERDIDRWHSEGGHPAGEPRAIDVPRTPAAALSHLGRTLRLARKVAVAAAGGGLLIVGVALIFLPGPAILVIPLGLALLATEFPWAARLLLYLKVRATRVVLYLKERAAGLVERGRRALARRSPT